MNKKYYYNLTYNVIYDANGGTGTTIDSNNPYINGSTVTVLNNSFTKSSSTFNNWNTAADGSGTSYNPGDTLTITSNITLYAQWVTYSAYSFGGFDGDTVGEFKNLSAETNNGRPGYPSSVSQSTFDQATLSDAVKSHNPIWCTTGGTYDLDVAFTVSSGTYKIKIYEIIGHFNPITETTEYQPLLGGDTQTFTMSALPAAGGGYVVSNTFTGLSTDYAATCVYP